MAPKQLPESVKHQRIGLKHGAGVTGQPFKIPVGPREVILLLALAYWWEGQIPAAGNNTIELGLWKKTDSDPDYINTAEHDMIWTFKSNRFFVTESIPCSGDGSFVFPWPVILVRSPRMVINSTLYTTARGSIHLYYLIERVSDADLAQFMVKDHE